MVDVPTIFQKVLLQNIAEGIKERTRKSHNVTDKAFGALSLLNLFLNIEIIEKAEGHPANTESECHVMFFAIRYF